MINFDIKEKRYENNESFSLSCNLTFDKCGLVVLKGDNGSGKTTLLNIIGLLDDEFKGTFKIGRIDASTDKKEFEKFRQNNFGYIGSIGFNNEYNTNLISNASDGEKLFFESKKVLGSDKKIYILDEITSPLDEIRFQEIRDLILKKKEHALILLATHDYRLIDDADEVIEFEHGKIISHKVNYKENIPLNFDNESTNDSHNGAIKKLLKKMSVFFAFSQAVLLALGIFSSLYFPLLFPRYDILSSQIEVGKVYQIRQATTDDLKKLMSLDYKVCFPYHDLMFYCDDTLEEGLYCDKISAQEYYAIYEVGDIIGYGNEKYEIKSLDYEIPGIFIGNKKHEIDLSEDSLYGIYIKNNQVKNLFMDVVKSFPSVSILGDELFIDLDKISYATMLTKNYFYQSFIVIFIPILIALAISLFYFSINLVNKEHDFIIFNRLNGILNFKDMKKVKMINLFATVVCLAISETVLYALSFPFYKLIFNSTVQFSALNFYWIGAILLFFIYVIYLVISTLKFNNLQYKKGFIKL